MIIIGLAGGSGSGKTYVAEHIRDELPEETVIFSMDRYYLPFKDKSLFERMQLNFDRPETLDWELMQEHLKKLREGESIDMPVYSYEKSTRIGTEEVEPNRIIIIEGIYALYNSDIRDMMDLKVFLDLDADVRALRRLKRDVNERDRNVDFAVRQYLENTKKMHEKLVAPTKKHADLRLDRSETDSFIDKIVEMFREKEFKSENIHDYLKKEI